MIRYYNIKNAIIFFISAILSTSILPSNWNLTSDFEIVMVMIFGTFFFEKFIRATLDYFSFFIQLIKKSDVGKNETDN